MTRPRRLTLTIDDPLAPYPPQPSNPADSPPSYDAERAPAPSTLTTPAAEPGEHAVPQLDPAGDVAAEGASGNGAPVGAGEGLSWLALSGRLRSVAIDQITPNPQQPRARFDEETLAALAESIRERGILQPPVVRELPDGL